jgi:predicted ATPase
MREENSTRRERLVEALAEFGVNSSLFRRITVKGLGKRPSDPFQILVAMAGPPANLLDVGYGVSQALPVVVQSVLAERGRMLLLQQPEVHLHPRGQAALGSFFSKLIAKDAKRFVIETHSDYLLDRVRTEVARSTLRPDDVQILFFEKSGIETTVHEISIDKQGNVVGAPPTYRSFFMEEERALMGRAV